MTEQVTRLPLPVSQLKCLPETSILARLANVFIRKIYVRGQCKKLLRINAMSRYSSGSLEFSVLSPPAVTPFSEKMSNRKLDDSINTHCLLSPV